MYVRSKINLITHIMCRILFYIIVSIIPLNNSCCNTAKYLMRLVSKFRLVNQDEISLINQIPNPSGRYFELDI